MKCQFCHERCRLLKEGEPDFTTHDMTWYCPQHPTRVLHHVELEKYALRRDRDIRGVSRTWRNTSIQWVNDRGQSMSAHYRRSDNEEPGNFVVYQITKGKERYQDRYNEVFRLEEYPKDFTPENIVRKIGALTIFS